jgi:hypothetical protein
MKRENRALLCLCLFAAGTSGCAVVSSSDVNPSTIYSQYSVDYEESSNKLAFNASFFVGGETGTYVELDEKSSVMLDSQPLAKDKTIFNQIVYENESVTPPQSLSTVYTFTYTDDSGNIYRNPVRMPGRIAWNGSQATSASIAAGVSVRWQSATAIGRDESVVVAISGSNSSAAESAWSGSTSGKIVFSPQVLNSFKPGPATMTLCRSTYTNSVQGTPAGGSLSVRYCATPILITLTQ